MRQIQHMAQTSFWSEDGRPISAEQFMQNLYGQLPDYFADEAELREIWSHPQTRQRFLERLAEAGYGQAQLETLQSLINAEDSDLYDVLEYVAYAIEPLSRQQRVARASTRIFQGLTAKQAEFLDFVLQQYVAAGVGELSEDKLPDLLKLKYQALADALAHLGDDQTVRATFIDFQKHLYQTV